MGLVSGRGHYEAVVRRVLTAQFSVWIATANLKQLMVERVDVPDRGGARSHLQMTDVFDDLAARGVELRILHARLPSLAFREGFDRHPRLIRGGLDLRLCPRTHFKAVVVDGAFLYLGSANWTGAGIGARGVDRRNFEMGLITGDLNLLDQVQAQFDRIWRGELCEACELQCEAPLNLPGPEKPWQ